MGLTLSTLFSRLFGKKQMRILMGEPLLLTLLTLLWLTAPPRVC